MHGGGVINLSNIDISNYALSTDTSAYLTSKCLWGQNQSNAETWYFENGYIRKGATRTNSTSSDWYMPITRLYNVTKLKVQTKFIQTTGSYFDMWNFGIGYVDSNNVLHREMITPDYYRNHYSDWTEVEFDFSSRNVPYVDYVVFWGCDGSPGFKPTVEFS